MFNLPPTIDSLASHGHENIKPYKEQITVEYEEESTRNPNNVFQE